MENKTYEQISDKIINTADIDERLFKATAFNNMLAKQDSAIKFKKTLIEDLKGEIKFLKKCKFKLS